MKRLFVGFCIALLTISVMFVFVACDNSGEVEPNLKYLIVTQQDVAYSEGWSFAQFISHSNSDRGYTVVTMAATQLAVDLPRLYIRTLDLDAQEVTHTPLSIETMRRKNNPDSVISMNSRGTVGRASSVNAIDEVIELYHILYAHYGTISFRIVLAQA